MLNYIRMNLRKLVCKKSMRPHRCISLTSVNKTKQPPSSSVGPNAFYESDMYDATLSLQATKAANEARAQGEALEERASPELIAAVRIRITDIQSPVRAHLKSVSSTMNESVYFYNERNPHFGMCFNIKETLYNFFHLIGPLKTAWYDVLMKDPTLVELIIRHLREQKCTSDHEQNTPETTSIQDIVALIETIMLKTGISCLKHTRSVKDGNCIQFKYYRLSRDEIVLLQVLAQYAYYNYEII